MEPGGGPAGRGEVSMYGAEEQHATSRRQLETLHAELRRDFPGIRRMALAIYDPPTDLLHTFLHSTEGQAPFSLYAARLADVPSLAELAARGETRVLDDLDELAASPARHSRLLIQRGYRSSYTRPFYDRGALAGFLFFDSDLLAYFDSEVVRRLDTYAQLATLLVLHALEPARLLRSAVDVAREMSHLRDRETGAHLDRMARYARLIAREIAGREGRDDEFVEFVFLFAPLHDVGKIGIPDRVLLKTGPLSTEEAAIMRGHVDRGVRLVDTLASAFGLAGSPHLELLRAIVACHHENVDGSGYPRGLADAAIPLEARIVAVADVFDALTSERSYKSAWTNDEAFAFLEEHAGRRFDAECVRALVVQRAEVEAIQRRFREGEDELTALHEACAAPV